MSDDIAVPQLNEPTDGPASATSEPGSGTHLPGSPHRDRIGPSGLVAWLLVAIAAVGLLASTPPSAAPDEPIQQSTAWYVWGHVLPPGITNVEYSVPVSLVPYPCYAGAQDQTAACMPPPSREMGSAIQVLNYPPPYYWFVGAGQRLASLVGLEYAGIGGRLASFILIFGTLLLLTLYMRRRNPLWGDFLLLVSTPMAVFFCVVVNSSGWEITCGIAMAAILAEAAWGRESRASGEWSRSTIAILALASIGLSTARPLGFFWAAGLTVSAIALAPSIRRGLLRVVGAVAPGIAVGFLWYVTHQYGLAAPSTLHGLVKSFFLTLSSFPEYIRHMFGVLGWLDTPMPALLLLANIAAWAVLLTRLPSIRKTAMVCGVFGIVVVPCAISATVWTAWPLWWQGRYGMPFALGFMLLLLLRSGRFIPRTISTVSSISLLSLGVMVWINEARYGVGLDNFGLPARLGNFGMSPVRLGISAVIGAFLVLVSGWILARAWRSKSDFVLSNSLPRPIGAEGDYPDN